MTVQRALSERQKIRMIRKFSAVKPELCDIGFQHSRNLIFPQSIAGLQQDFGVFVAEGFISHLLKNSEHGSVIHVVPVDHGILTLCGTIPLKKMLPAVRHSPL